MLYTMRRRDLLHACAAAPLALAARRAESQESRYEPAWESIDRRPCPKWYTDAKFGIFIHWGVYSVPSYAPVRVKGENPYAEWYWNSLTNGKKARGPAGGGALTWNFHQRVYGANFSYFDFAPLFRAELYDPGHWAEVFERSGAKYVALTSKHHEGFTLWRSEHANRSWGRPWNAIVPRRPWQEILLGEVDAPAGVQALLLEGNQKLETQRTGKQLRIQVPESLAASLPEREAYVFKIRTA
jgi:alpha-L-fucosidase